MAKAITVKQLYAELGKLIKQGNGNRKIMLTDDDECNGIHQCWYYPSVWNEDELKCINLPFGVTPKDVAESYLVLG